MVAENAAAVTEAMLLAAQRVDIALCVQIFRALDDAGHLTVIRAGVHEYRAAQTARNAAGKLRAGQTGTLCAACDAAEERARLRRQRVVVAHADLVHLGGAHDRAAHALIRDQNIRAVAEQQHRNALCTQHLERADQLPARLGQDEKVGRAADGKGRVAAHRLVDQNVYFRGGFAQSLRAALDIVQHDILPPV